MTNADRIRSMADEELLDFLNQYDIIDMHCVFEVCSCFTEDTSCKECWLNWLREEVNENDS